MKTTSLEPTFKLFFAIVLLLVCGDMAQASETAVDITLFQPSLKRLDNLPRSAEDNAKVELGRQLFYEKRLSKDNSISCNSCHDLQKYGVDGEAFSIGVGNVRVGRNSPTVYNAWLHITQFWDGRASTVEEQAKGPILAAKEMAMPSPDAVVAKLKAIVEYRELFRAAFPRSSEPITYENIGLGIGAFERYLSTPSRFDAYLEGDKKALTAEELRGLSVFVKSGCSSCHNGTLLGGQLYQKAGLVKPWKNQTDPGRFELTRQESDKFVFKVPALRNVARTGPYFHDSTAKTLEEAVRTMAQHQLGLELAETDVKAVVAFLTALTGELPTEYIAQRPLAGTKRSSASPLD